MGKTYVNINDLVSRIKSSENYESFREILPMKMKNEAEAKEILISNVGKLNHGHLKEIFNLIDEPYPYLKNGKVTKEPWFGRLLKSNTAYLVDESEEKLNEWYGILTNNSQSIVKRLELLLSGTHRIRGLNVGFITLMLYVLDKDNYLIWFEGLHNALTIFYPDLDKYSGSSDQYLYYNDHAKEFAKRFEFDHTELDWVLSTGVKDIVANQSTPIFQYRNGNKPLPTGEGIIDNIRNPFTSADWIQQNRSLTLHLS